MRRMTEDSQNFSKEEIYPCPLLYNFSLSFSILPFELKSPLSSNFLLGYRLTHRFAIKRPDRTRFYVRFNIILTKN
jgi:hypothetical protein